MKVLNLYAGIGGNRKLWTDCEVTAVENNPEIAKIYQDFFPDDKVVVADAHQYLLDHYKEFDFIWSSPPCVTHTILNYALSGMGIIRYPNMDLYQEIVFLKTFFKGKYCVENVKGYYDPLVIPKILGRHFVWTNFYINDFGIKNNFEITNQKKRVSTKMHIKRLQKIHGISLENFRISNKATLLQNCLTPKLGLYIFNQALQRIDKNKYQQLNLLD